METYLEEAGGESFGAGAFSSKASTGIASASIESSPSDEVASVDGNCKGVGADIRSITGISAAVVGAAGEVDMDTGSSAGKNADTGDDTGVGTSTFSMTSSGSEVGLAIGAEVGVTAVDGTGVDRAT